MKLTDLAVPFSFGLVSFIAYPSQYLFRHIEPGPLTNQQSLFLNLGTLAVFISYTRCVATNPGRVVASTDNPHGVVETFDSNGHGRKQRWCKKCDAYKPPRAHHCRVCKRYGRSLLLPSMVCQSSSNEVKMHPKDGPSLPMDHQLRRPSYNTALRPLPRLGCHHYVVPAVPLFPAWGLHLGEAE